MDTASSKKAWASGVLLVLLFACTAFFLSSFESIKALKISPLIVGIILGMIYANTLRSQLPSEWTPGVSFCSKQILRFGIILYGFQISLADVQAVGLAALVIDALVVVSTLVLGVFVAKLMKMDSQTALLTSVGSSICGAAAVLGAEPVVKGAPYKAAVAVSTVVIFGTLAMFIYPACFRAGLFDMNAQEIGLFTGATLHEVAHVYGAGDAMNAAALCEGDIQRHAVIVKMIRVMMLAPVLLVLSFMLRSKGEGGKGAGRIQLPWFAFYFVGVILFNSLDLLPANWVEILRAVATFLLTMAMTALGMNTTIAQFKQAGAKPFILALILFAWLVFGGYYMVKLLAGI